MARTLKPDQFLSGTKLNRATLERFVTTIDWGSGRGPQNASIELSNRVGRFHQLVRDRAEKLRRSSATVLRNLIAEAPEHELACYRALLETETGAELLPAESIEQVREYLGPASPDLKLIVGLLRLASKPDEDLTGYFGDRLAPLLWYTAGLPKKRSAAAEIKRAIKQDPSSLDVLLEDLTEDRLVYLWRESGAPRLEEKELAQLSAESRRKLLRSKCLRLTLLSRGLRQAIVRSPLDFPEAPEFVKLIERRVASLKAGLDKGVLRTATVHNLLEVPLTPDVERSILAACARFEPRTRRRRGRTSVPRDLAKAARASVAKSGVVFLLLDEEARANWVRSLPLEVATSLAHRLPTTEWVPTLTQTTESRDLTAVTVALSAAERLERVMAVAGRQSDRGRGRNKLDWIERLDANTIERAIQSDSRFASWLATSRGVDPVWRLNFTPSLARHVGTGDVLKLLSPKRIRDWESARGGDHVARQLRQVFDEISDPAWAATLTRHIALVSDDLFRSTFQEPVEAEPWRRIMEALPTHSKVFDPKVVLELTDPRNDCIWETVVREAVESSTPIPTVLSTAISKADESILLTAAEHHPAGFLPLALRKLPLESLLPLAFARTRVGLRLDSLVSRTRLRKLIPWVRQKWAEKPALATAYELALAFSLADAGLLVDLARQAGREHRKYRRRKKRPRGFLTEHRYKTYELPKQSGGTRTITVPDPLLKRLQRRLLDRGLSEVPLHDAAKGFRRDHSIVDNAREHVGQPMVVNVDIDSFFPNTSFGLIAHACSRTAGGALSKRAVMLMADICSYRGGLPIGAPSSPAIGNVVLEPVDRAIAAACARHEITYTRYADDLTFSGHGNTHRILPFVKRVLEDFGYAVKERKVNLFRKGRRQVVTGLVVNEKVNLPRRIRRRLRAAVHQRSLGKQPHWHGAPMSDSALLGRIAFLQTVQPAEAERHKERLRQAPGLSSGGGA